MGNTRRYVHAAALSAAMLLAACAAVPDADLPLDTSFGAGQVPAPPSSASVPELPPATGPARPSPGCKKPVAGSTTTTAATTPSSGPPSDAQRTIKVGNTNREYLLHVPAGATP